jgi:hypothetical protein
MRCQMETYTTIKRGPHRCHRGGMLFGSGRHLFRLCYQHREKYRRHPDLYADAIHNEDFWAAHGQPDVNAQ